jgi:uncharacterized protein
MHEKAVHETEAGYLGEPEKEVQEEISGNIGRTTPGQGPASVLCLRLKIEGLATKNAATVLPTVCWEKMCAANDHVTTIAPPTPSGSEAIFEQLGSVGVPFGDFWPIIRTLSPSLASTTQEPDAGGRFQEKPGAPVPAPVTGERMDSGDLFSASRFLTLLNRDRAYCLIHSLTQRKVFGGEILRSLYTLFKTPRNCDNVKAQLASTYPESVLDGAISDLREKGLIVPSNETDTGIYLSLFQQGLNQYPIRHMYILPTSDCNLRCRYCFLEDCARDLSPVYMTEEAARKSLEIFARLTEEADTISITFYGGEPLLNSAVVLPSLRYVRMLEDRGVFRRPVELSLLTNGTRMDDEAVEVIRETGTDVSVSLDGPAHLNGARRAAGGGETVKKALAGYWKLREAGISAGISCTLNQYNAGHIEEAASFFADDLGVPGMGFNVLLPHAGGHNPAYVPSDLAATQIIRAFQILREKGVYEDRMMRRIIPYRCNGFCLKDCMGVGGQIVVTPEGKIGPCQAFLGYEEYFPFTVDNLHARLPDLTSEHIYRNSLFNEWRHRFPLNMKQCLDCFALSICGGGCPYASVMSKGSLWDVDERVCSQSRMIMEWMLWDTYDRMTGKNAGPTSQT